MVVTIFNSKDKMQKKLVKTNFLTAMVALNRVQGKAGWWARLEYDDGDMDIFHYVNGEWYN